MVRHPRHWLAHFCGDGGVVAACVYVVVAYVSVTAAFIPYIFHALVADWLVSVMAVAWQQPVFLW